MKNIGDEFLVVFPQSYIAIVEYIGLNKENNYLKYGSPLFKIIDFINKEPHIHNLKIGVICDSNIYYRNRDFIISLKNKQKEIISIIFEF